MTLFLRPGLSHVVRTAEDIEFSRFVADAEPRLRQALVAIAGPEAARDAVADALAYGWAHWSRVRTMDNPAGYLYRVARTQLPREGRFAVAMPAVESSRLPDVEPALPGALAQLTERQRAAVFLIEGCDWTLGDVAAFLGISVSSVRNHLSRGLDRLRTILEVSVDA